VTRPDSGRVCGVSAIRLVRGRLPVRNPRSRHRPRINLNGTGRIMRSPRLGAHDAFSPSRSSKFRRGCGRRAGCVRRVGHGGHTAKPCASRNTDARPNDHDPLHLGAGAHPTQTPTSHPSPEKSRSTPRDQASISDQPEPRGTSIVRSTGYGDTAPLDTMSPSTRSHCWLTAKSTYRLAPGGSHRSKYVRGCGTPDHTRCAI
jgi:hypothetical protein